MQVEGVGLRGSLPAALLLDVREELEAVAARAALGARPIAQAFLLPVQARLALRPVLSNCLRTTVTSQHGGAHLGHLFLQLLISYSS